MSSLPNVAMSEEAYFEMLEKSLHKYEYWGGMAVAMAGGQPENAVIEGNVFGELFQQVRGRDCRPMGANLAVKLAGGAGYVFPDVSVVCGKPEYVVRRGIGCLLNPVAIFEVLSPSTADIDENYKLAAYMSIRSVRDYVIVSTTQRVVKLYSRSTPDEVWRARIFENLEDTVQLESCGCALTLSQIYAGVDVPAMPPLGDGGF